jgi:hypothetical protein
MGLSSPPGPTQHLWALSTDSQTLSPTVDVSRIDIETAEVEDVFVLTPAALGITNRPFLNPGGIAIDPLSATAAVLGTVLGGGGIEDVLFAIDLGSGDLTSAPVIIELPTFLIGLAYSPDGSQLYTIVDVAADPAPLMLATIDLTSGALSELGPMPVARALTFDPRNGDLLAVGSGNSLIRLSPTTGEVLETIGPMGPGAFFSLAFVPEPGTGLLLAAALLATCRARKR